MSFFVLTMGMRRGIRKLWLRLWNEIFLDYGYMKTMSFLYTINIILKMGPLSYNILKNLFYMVLFLLDIINLKLISHILIKNFYMMSHLYGF